jgi:hypothetical protein
MLRRRPDARRLSPASTSRTHLRTVASLIEAGWATAHTQPSHGPADGPPPPVPDDAGVRSSARIAPPTVRRVARAPHQVCPYQVDNPIQGKRHVVPLQLRTCDLGIQVGGDPGHPGLGGSAIRPEGVDRGVRLASGGAVQAGLVDHREQRRVTRPLRSSSEGRTPDAAAGSSSAPEDRFCGLPDPVINLSTPQCLPHFEQGRLDAGSSCACSSVRTTGVASLTVAGWPSRRPAVVRTSRPTITPPDGAPPD